MTSPAADLEARATRETQKLDALIHDLGRLRRVLGALDLPIDVARRLARAIDAERGPLVKARDALDGYRTGVRTTRGNTWHTDGDR